MYKYTYNKHYYSLISVQICRKGREQKNFGNKLNKIIK